MKLWFKVQTWVTLIALIYVFFIFNDGYLGGLLMDVVFGFIMEELKSLGQNFIEAIVDSALNQ
jgi:hypothetical protein